jgi:hypothetical protein
MFLYLFTISIQLYSVEMIINGKIPISGWSSNKRKTYEESDNESGLWSLPEEGWITVEVDGSFVSQSGQAGIGVVAREETCISPHGEFCLIVQMQLKKRHEHV